MCVLGGRTAPRTAAMDTLRWGGGAGGTTLGEWEHNNILCVFIFQIILIFDVFFSFKINFLLVVYLKI